MYKDYIINSIIKKPYREPIVADGYLINKYVGTKIFGNKEVYLLSDDDVLDLLDAKDQEQINEFLENSRDDYFVSEDALAELHDRENDKQMEEIFDRLKEHGKSKRGVKAEILEFNNKIMSTANQNKLDLKNGCTFFKSIAKISADEINDDLRVLMLSFLYDSSYVLELKKKKPFNEYSFDELIVAFIKLQASIGNFIERLNVIRECENHISQLMENIKNDACAKTECSSSQCANILLECLEKFLGIDVNSQNVKDNIDYIDGYICGNEDLKKIYPVAAFRILIKNRSKISQKMVAQINLKVLFNYKAYNILEDNAKNFDTYNNYIFMYWYLLDECCKKIPEIDIFLCMHMFEKISNLSQWSYEHHLHKNLDDYFGFSKEFLKVQTYTVDIYNPKFYSQSFDEILEAFDLYIDSYGKLKTKMDAFIDQLDIEASGCQYVTARTVGQKETVAVIDRLWKEFLLKNSEIRNDITTKQKNVALIALEYALMDNGKNYIEKIILSML